MKRLLTYICVLVFLSAALPCRAESQQNQDYKGVTDPFGDPANYEFAEDEKEDKEFFHLGRYIMIGLDAGVATFTGGLGKTVSPGFLMGMHLVYFFDRAIAMEAGAHYSNHLDSVTAAGGRSMQIDTNMIPLTFGFRYYFDTKNAPKAIAIANPYLVAGGGIYIRQQTVISKIGFTVGAPGGSSSTSSFGGFGGGGVEFAVYHKHVYLGLDARYHFVFFPDANDTWNNTLVEGSRAGGYVTTALTLTYNF